MAAVEEPQLELNETKPIENGNTKMSPLPEITLKEEKPEDGEVQGEDSPKKDDSPKRTRRDSSSRSRSRDRGARSRFRDSRDRSFSRSRSRSYSRRRSMSRSPRRSPVRDSRRRERSFSLSPIRDNGYQPKGFSRTSRGFVKELPRDVSRNFNNGRNGGRGSYANGRNRLVLSSRHHI